jgi:septum formation protein
MKVRRDVILASGSAVRRQLLASAGVTFGVEPAQIDEAELKDQFIRHTTCAPTLDIALFLAEAKALDVSARHPEVLVIGCDQVLALGEAVLSKAVDVAAARRVLMALRGRSHELNSAVVIALDGKIIWSYGESAQLTMRQFSDDFLDSYISDAGEAVLRSVGAYELEGQGLQLFERIEGDYFTILGLPMLPLLTELRTRGALSV